MKRLILIQNDYAGAGKTTLAQCFDHYLNIHRVPHHNAVLTETIDVTRSRSQMDADDLKLPVFIGLLDKSDLLILEIETGMTDLSTASTRRTNWPTCCLKWAGTRPLSCL